MFFSLFSLSCVVGAFGVLGRDGKVRGPNTAEKGEGKGYPKK